jgi:ABC-2 type transport system ATP-binding protein
MRPALEVQRLTRSFGSFVAVNNISFQVNPGEVCGFIGPNGAGKTTTMRIISTLDLPDTGDVFLSGHSVLEEPRLARRMLGFMPDSYGAYSQTTVADYLDFFSRAYKLGAGRQKTIDRLVDFTGLSSMLEKHTDALSKGMKQRVCLARTLLSDPDLLVLDEPAAGLDPRARIELRELVKALASMGKAVLISSHILSELGEMCDSVVIIEAGTIKAGGSVDEITAGLRKSSHNIFLRALCTPEVLERALLEMPGVESVHQDKDGVVVRFGGGDAQLAHLVESLVQHKLGLLEVTPKSMDLEDVFLSVTDGEVQ